MIYNKILYFFGFLHYDLQIPILVALGIMSICVFKLGKKLRINLCSLTPILLILSLTVLNRLIYFFTMVDVSD